MARCLCVLATILSLGLAGELRAADSAARLEHGTPGRLIPASCCCPDDYGPKPLPCIKGPAGGCCPDDYCPKPLPRIRCPLPGSCPDDYCPKPMPNLCRPLDRTFYRCVPTDPAR